MKASSLQPRQASSTIDIGVEGKQHGHLTLPCASAGSAFGTVQIPVCVIRNGEGPVVALLAGSRGDEFDGQIALHNLADSIQVDQINGCLIIVPAMNPMAVSTHSRLCGVDGRDLDTCFPGNESGSVSEQVAAHLFNTVVEPADLIIELQSGGSTMFITPLAAVHFNTENSALQDSAEQNMIAFGAPYSARLLPGQSGSLAASTTVAQKPFLAGQHHNPGNCKNRLLQRTGSSWRVKSATCVAFNTHARGELGQKSCHGTLYRFAGNVQRCRR